MSREIKMFHEGGFEYLRQPIHFKAGIMREYYVGDMFIGIVGRNYFDDGEISGLCQKAGINGFMPELARELKEEVIGIDSKYDGYELGRNIDSGAIDEVNFYFIIKRHKYSDVMKNLKFWSIAKGFDELIYFDVKKLQYSVR